MTDHDDLFARAMNFDCSLIERNKILVEIRHKLEDALRDIERRRLLANLDHETIARYAEDTRALKAERDKWVESLAIERCRVSLVLKSRYKLHAEFRDLQRTFDLMWDADQRAIKRWQDAAPPGEDRSLIWPDRSKLTEWLLNERDRAVKASETK